MTRGEYRLLNPVDISTVATTADQIPFILNQSKGIIIGQLPRSYLLLVIILKSALRGKEFQSGLSQDRVNLINVL